MVYSIRYSHSPQGPRRCLLCSSPVLTDWYNTFCLHFRTPKVHGYATSCCKCPIFVPVALYTGSPGFTTGQQRKACAGVKEEIQGNMANLWPRQHINWTASLRYASGYYTPLINDRSATNHAVCRFLAGDMRLAEKRSVRKEAPPGFSPIGFGTCWPD